MEYSRFNVASATPSMFHKVYYQNLNVGLNSYAVEDLLAVYDVR